MRNTIRLIFTLLFVSLCADAQWRPSPYSWQYVGTKNDSLLIVPKLLVNPSLLESGAIRWNILTATMQVFDGSIWQDVGVRANLYTEDGSISGTRSVSVLGGGNLQFTGNSGIPVLQVRTGTGPGAQPSVYLPNLPTGPTCCGDVLTTASDGRVFKLTVPVASGITTGYLSSSDWDAFNSKAAGSGDGNYIWNGITPQTADFNIAGTGILDGQLTLKSNNTASNPLTDASLLLTNSSVGGLPTVTFQQSGAHNNTSIYMQGTTVSTSTLDFGALKITSDFSGSPVDIVTFALPIGVGDAGSRAAAFGGRVSGETAQSDNDFVTYGQLTQRKITRLTGGGTYAVSFTDYAFLNRATSGNPVLNLTGAALVGQILIIKEAAADPITNGVSWTPAARYDDSQSFSDFDNPILSGFTSVMLQYDGADWWIIGRM